MRKELQKKAEEYIRGGSQRKRFRVLVSVLSLVVTLSTLYILSTPAMTLEKTACLDAEGQTGTGELITTDASLNPQEEENAPSGESASEDGNAEGDNEPSPENDSDVGQTVGDEAPQDGGVNDDTQSGEGNSGDDETADDEEYSGETENPAENDIDENTPFDDAPADDSQSPEDSGEEEEGKASESEETDTEETEAKCERSVYEYVEDGLTVTAVLSDPAAVSDEAELFVTRITEEINPERYAQLALLLANNDRDGEAAKFLAYDISIMLDGAEIEPAVGTVSVTIRDTAESAVTAEAAEDIQVYHVLNEDSDVPELRSVPVAVTAEADEQEISFTAESFSAYVVTLPSGDTYTMPDGTKMVIQYGSSLKYKLISIRNDFLNYAGTYYNPNSPLGIAGSFHIVAFSTATLSSHTNGNVLANTLIANVNFGTSGLANELSYAKERSKIHATSASSTNHVLALGSGNAVRLTNNNNSFSINGTKLDAPNNVWQDANSANLPFIDLNEVKSQIGAISAALASISSNVNVVSHLNPAQSCNGSYVELDEDEPDGIGIFNISASNLSSYSHFGIKGLQSGHSGTVIINVDCAGATVINLPECKVFIDNNELSFNGVTSFVNGRVIWNFVNCTGTINTKLTYASIIAPDATINVTQNLNGTIIANNVNINSESHRDDFVGKLPACVTVSKVWRDSDGTQICGTALEGMSVTVQLFRSVNGGAKTAVGSTVTLNDDNSWSCAWAGLTKGYTYSVEEIAVTKNGSDISGYYSVTYSSDGLCSGTIYVYNQFQYSLPSTGGKGTQPFTIVGLFLIGTVFYLNTKLKRPGTKGGAPYSS